MNLFKYLFIILVAFVFISCEKSNPVQSKLMQSNNKLITEYDKMVDYAFNGYTDKRYNAGFNIALINGENVYTYSYGETSLGKGILSDQNTMYEIGSITKVFTAISLLYYLETHNISINAPIKNYLPISLNGKLNKNGIEITFQHLLNHTSGLERIPSDIISSKNPYAGYDSTKIFNYLSNHNLVYTPGTFPINEDEISSHYSNLAYALAGIILERSLNKSLNGIFSEYIFGKFNMSSSTLNDISTNSNIAFPHNLLGNTSYWDMSGFAAAGGIKSNLNDMVKFTINQINNIDDEKLNYVINECQIPLVSLNGFPVFGLGWEFFTMENGQKILVKDGGTGGFTSFIAICKDSKKGIVALFNNNAESNQSEFVIRLINSYFK